MFSAKERSREKKYVDNSLNQLLAYKNAREFFRDKDMNTVSLLEFSEIHNIDFTDACFGAIKSPDDNNSFFIAKIKKTTTTLLSMIISNLPDGPYKITRRDQLEILKNTEHDTHKLTNGKN